MICSKNLSQNNPNLIAFCIIFYFIYLKISDILPNKFDQIN